MSLSEADEVYIIGYSIPDADQGANILFTTLKDNIKVYVINTAAKKVVDKIWKFVGFPEDGNRIQVYDGSFEDWVNENKPEYVSYKKFL